MFDPENAEETGGNGSETGGNGSETASSPAAKSAAASTSAGPGDSGKNRLVDPEPDPEKPWTIQVAAVTRDRDAAGIVDKWLKIGYPAFVARMRRTSGETLFRIRVGHFATRKEAYKALAAIKTKKADAYIVRQKTEGNTPE